MAGELGKATRDFTCGRCGGTFSEPWRAGRTRILCSDCFGTPDGDTAKCIRCGETKSISEFSPDPCKGNGLRSYCRPCDRKNASEWGKANQERKNASSRAWYANNRDRFRAYDLKRKYGITQADYDDLLRKQDGCCAICGTDDPRHHGRFHVDHDHETDVVRGLLCHACNTALGGFCEDVDVLTRAIAYLEEHSHGG